MINKVTFTIVDTMTGNTLFNGGQEELYDWQEDAQPNGFDLRTIDDIIMGDYRFVTLTLQRRNENDR